VLKLGRFVIERASASSLGVRRFAPPLNFQKLKAIILLFNQKERFRAQWFGLIVDSIVDLERLAACRLCAAPGRDDLSCPFENRQI
jgi:hypothetical protein